MRIYSDTLTVDDLRETAQQVPGLYIDELSAIVRPRVRAHGWTVQTSGNTNRYRNSGVYGADTSTRAASWDQHGQWFNLICERDPNARVGFYDNARDFHDRTKRKYATTPEPSTLATHGVYIEGA